jgi:hypothetical protein
MLGSGIALDMSSCALSLRMPVGSPAASRTIVPPATSFVARVTFALASARELARFMCPSSRLIQTGLFGVTESIQLRSGSAPPQLV